MKITKAIFPVAGLGTRFLPATKASPKEMLTIVDKPAIQYAVEEAIAAGIKELIFVTSQNKRAIEDHFDSNFELETVLEQRGKTDLLAAVRNIIPDDVSCVYVRQKQPLGLGHAVLCAEQLIGDESFVVILADMLLSTEQENCLGEMIKLCEAQADAVIAVQSVPQAEISNFGIVNAQLNGNKSAAIKSVIEKPSIKDAPSDLGIIGRYILTPEIFQHLKHTQADKNKEIQLTDAIAKLITQKAVYAYQFSGQRFDTGSKLGYLAATLTYASKHPELGEGFQNLVKQFVKDLA